MVSTEEKRKIGKKSRKQGLVFENKVREDLEKKGWVVSKWTNNVELNYNWCAVTEDSNPIHGKLVKAKAKWIPGRPMMLGSGFPDFIIYKNLDLHRFGCVKCGKINQFDYHNSYEIIGVESKMDGKLDKIEKEKCKWLLDNHIFSKILVAKKGTKRGQIVYEEFK